VTRCWTRSPRPWLSGEFKDGPQDTSQVELTVTGRRSDQLRGLDLPVTIVIGERSQPYFHRIARRLERLLPLRTLSDASHAP
jgi:hypothetical protein